MVAVRLVATVRAEDTVARVGGDEFIRALWHVSGIDYAAAAASRAIEAVSQPYDIEGSIVSITTSGRCQYLSRPWRGRGDADEERGLGLVRGQVRGQECLSSLGAEGIAGRVRFA